MALPALVLNFESGKRARDLTGSHLVTFHSWHQIRHIENVQLIRPDMIAKAILKRHYIVKRELTADRFLHRI